MEISVIRASGLRMQIVLKFHYTHQPSNFAETFGSCGELEIWCRLRHFQLRHFQLRHFQLLNQDTSAPIIRTLDTDVTTSISILLLVLLIILHTLLQNVKHLFVPFK